MVYLNNESQEDVLLRDRVQVAADTLGCSQSHLIRCAINYALDHVKDFRQAVR